jgi:5-formyltetrahydrofolate cyclo-ligase
MPAGVADCRTVGHDQGVDSVSGDVEAIRAEMLARQHRLRHDAVSRSSAIILERLLGLPEMFSARTIGAYMGIRGEVDPSPLRDDRRFEVALPVTTAGEALGFVVPDGPLHPGPYDIPQPDSGRKVDPHSLDVVLVPLVAADHRGNRVGHGAGFYDRTFAGCRDAEGAGPVLIGICHAFQVVPFLETQPWDVPMDLLVTDAGLVRPGS